ncbi:MAG TPA: PhoU domain-containing protein, partial [Longimicrobiales bacterium]|nr:PhoU domain-containing protein [Longimicrobiales bacterium]
MLREFLSLFKSDDAIARMGAGFGDMLQLTRDLILLAGRHFFEERPSADERTDILRRDVRVNKLERKIRKQVIAHLTLSAQGRQAPYGLLLMSLVKDVERIGDYAKNISEIYDEGGGPLPPEGEDANADELRELRRIVEAIFADVGGVFTSSDSDKATELIRVGKDVGQRADRLVTRIAGGPYDAATTVTLVLGARYYKRVCSHLMNILSGVVMPLHKLDYFDEDDLPLREALEGKEG